MPRSFKSDWRLEKIQSYILSHLDSVEVYGYAEPFQGFHYKTFWITPIGAIKLDTNGPFRLRKKGAYAIMRHYNEEASREPRRYGFRLFSAKEIIQNWKECGWDSTARDFEKKIAAAGGGL